MSATMQGVDARGYLAGWVGALADMTSKDIRAIPADKWTSSFGGCTRPANELVADAIWLLNWCTGALRGEATATEENDGMKQIAAQLTDADTACAQLGEAAQAFAAALKAADDDRLNSMVTAPWQMSAPLFMLAQIAVSHIWYHDGQLNYIQCLLGDEKVHWMGD
ncbi:MAG TPA: DinB family protein [Fimbriimonadaceae bacterium]|nr:DinB family protein [Fimbriimonadaceae bacterium]